MELVLHVDVPAPWHLYSLKHFEPGEGPFATQIVVPKGGAIAEVGKVVQGTPVVKMDPNFEKEVEYYEGSAEFRIPVRLSKTASGAAKITAAVQYQICTSSQCLNQTTPLPVAGTVQVSGTAVDDKTPLDQTPTTSQATPPTSKSAASAPVSDAEKAKSGGLLVYLGAAIGAGFLALLTPCVFPMIPITVSFFSKQKEGEKPLPKALAYCVGIIGTFTALGVAVAAIFGATGLQSLANNPWMNLGLAIVFVALAFSLFGFFEIGVPSSVLTKLDSKGRGGLLGPVLMGLTFSLTSFTCTLPFVGGVLVAASQGEFLWPIVGMLGFSTAFCLPFFLLALFPAALSKMPKSGGWLATVKAFMGFVELAAAMKFISTVDLGIVPNGLGIVTREVFLAVWFGVAVLAAMFLLGVVQLPHVYESKIGLLRRAMGVATLVGAGYLLAGINGRSIGELEAFLPPSDYGKAAGTGSTEGLAWLTDYDKAKAQARAEGKPLFIDFTGIYCTNCRWMEKNMFPKKDVEQRLGGYVRVKLFTDRGTQQDNANQAELKRLTNSVTLPAYVTIDPSGQPQTTEFTREQSAFAAFLDRGLGKRVALQ